MLLCSCEPYRCSATALADARPAPCHGLVCVWAGAAPSDTLRTRKRLEVERARAVVGELAKQLQLRPTEWAFDGGHMLLTTIPLRREKTALDVTLGRAGFQVCVNVQAGVQAGCV